MGIHADRHRRLAEDVPTSWATAAGETAEVYPARPGPGNPQKWQWQVVAPDGHVVAASVQRFRRRRAARRALARKFPPMPQSRTAQ